MKDSKPEIRFHVMNLQYDASDLHIQITHEDMRHMFYVSQYDTYYELYYRYKTPSHGSDPYSEYHTLPDNLREYFGEKAVQLLTLNRLTGALFLPLDIDDMPDEFKHTHGENIWKSILIDQKQITK